MAVDKYKLGIQLKIAFTSTHDTCTCTGALHH